MNYTKGEKELNVTSVSEISREQFITFANSNVLRGFLVLEAEGVSYSQEEKDDTKI